MTPLVLHSGFDGFEMSFKATLPTDLLEKLANAKEGAKFAKSDVPVLLGKNQCRLLPSGGRGGYAYVVNTGPLGGIWWFKEANARDPWAIRVSIHALPLALFGLAKVKSEIDDFFASLGVIVSPQNARVSRADFAIDLLLPEFALDPSLLVCPARSKKRTQYDKTANSIADRIVGVTVGKMPGKQVIIYDKAKEAADTKKPHWPMIWAANSGLNEEALKEVWRIEIRAGKKAIDALLGARPWPLIAPHFKRLFQSIASKIRLVSPKSDTNKSRWENDLIWKACLDAIDAIHLETTTTHDAEKILMYLEEEALTQLLNQYFGIEVTIAAALGFHPSNFDQLITNLAGERNTRRRELGPKFAEKFEEKVSLWQAKYQVGDALL